VEDLVEGVAGFRKKAFAVGDAVFAGALGEGFFSALDEAGVEGFGEGVGLNALFDFRFAGGGEEEAWVGGFLGGDGENEECGG
jgi:hypothetical protein